MPNQLNFGSPITSMISERMTRLTSEDQALISTGTKTILFGTVPFDNVEIWFYSPDGTFYSNVRLNPEDEALSLSTLVDSSGTQEVLNLDLDILSSRARLAPGRYGMAVYILRDEVGSLNGERLIINDISPSRTEIKIFPPAPSATLFRQIYEFVVPSVPPQYAKAILDEIFAESLDYKPDWTESLNALDVSRELNNITPTTIDRIVRSKAETFYVELFKTIKDRTYSLALELLVERVKTDWNVQHTELRSIIVESLQAVLAQMKDAKEIDPRFRLV
jgi:hypothetical protein